MSKPEPKCPMCSKPAQKEFWPFCSDRCQKVDLNRWLSEGYTIPGEPGENLSAEED